MTRRTNRLDRLQIPSPCPADWERMMGDEKIRYCNECDKYVYNLSNMTRNEAEAIVATAKGQLCVRLTRDADGKTLTEDRHAGLHLISRRVSPIASAVVTAMMSISGVAQPYTRASEPVSAYSQAGINNPGARAQTQSVTATLSGAVFDPSGALIPGVKLTLINESTGEEQTGASSEEGQYKFMLLKAGAYTLRSESPGFRTHEDAGITLRANEDQRHDVTMNPGGITMGGAVAFTPVLPLRLLYKESDRIVVARVGETVKVQTERERTLLRTTLSVSSNVKGTGKRSAIYVYHWALGERQDTYVSGDNIMVFLKKREGENGRKAKDAYEVNAPEYGVKKLNEADLEIYLRRIEELAAIMGQDKPKAEEIVEWLVRCAEQPATRWEGAFELETSATEVLRLGANLSGDEAKSGESAEGDAAEEDSNQVAEGQPLVDHSNLASGFAALLTARQKERLATALFDIDTITEDDMQLVNLVKDLGDVQLTPFLLSRLHRVEADPPEITPGLVRAIADLLKDEEVARAADEYVEKSNEVDEEEDEQPDVADGEQARAKETASATSAQRRGALLREFLSFVERKMSARPLKPLPR